MEQIPALGGQPTATTRWVERDRNKQRERETSRQTVKGGGGSEIVRKNMIEIKGCTGVLGGTGTNADASITANTTTTTTIKCNSSN